MSRAPARRPRRSAQQRRRVTMALAALATVGAAFLIAVLGAAIAYFAPGPQAQSGRATTVILTPGSSLPEIAAALGHARVIGSDTAFIFAAEVTGAAHRLKAGEYAFASRASLASVIAAIAEGKVVRHFVTVPEGTTSEGVMEILNRADYLTGFAPAPAEGTVLPETYEVRRGDDRAAVLRRMMDARDKVLMEAWAHRSPGLLYKDPEEAVTLASIVEKETALPEERRLIAGVFLNRLKTGMKLESDPTVIYGLTGGRPLGHGLRVSELQSHTEYNTYVIPGLPPHPIDNPGRETLTAVLDPSPTNDLYFVANGQGGHNFAATLAEHNANVAKWRKIEAARDCAPLVPGGKPIC